MVFCLVFFSFFKTFQFLGSRCEKNFEEEKEELVDRIVSWKNMLDKWI